MAKGKSNYQKAWGRLQTFRTLKNDCVETITYDVYINWDTMHKLAQKAADNKSASSKMGPVLVNITQAKTRSKQ